MSVLLGWMVLGVLVALVMFLPPIFMAKESYVGGYWDSFKQFNIFLWGFLGTVAAVTGLLVLGLNLIGVLNW